MMKNKALLRKTLAPIYPEFFYLQATLQELTTLDVSKFVYPFILKPNIGFFSIGVYTITNDREWDKVISQLEKEANDWGKIYPESVVNNEFILEEYIYGEEYAIDAYYDETGQAVILNILKHDFNGISDVSDRLYYTGKSIIEGYLQQFTDCLNEANKYFQAKNIPFHVEIRIRDGEITPVEFNPMRFAGWCCTDLTFFAFGFYTYDYYLNNIRPDWEHLLRGKAGKYYTIVVLDKKLAVEDNQVFDYDLAIEGMGKILNLRKIDYHLYPLFGFVFTEVKQTDKLVMRRIVEKDLNTYIKCQNKN